MIEERDVIWDLKFLNEYLFWFMQVISASRHANICQSDEWVTSFFHSLLFLSSKKKIYP